MLRAYTVVPVTAAAGWVAGAGTGTFLAAALAAAAAAWSACRPHPGERCFTTLDPRAPDAELVLDAFRQILARVRETNRPVRLRLLARTASAGAALGLAVTPAGDVELKAGAKTHALRQPGVWLPDHPLPLRLAARRSLTLVFEPCEPRRVRVSLPRAAACRPAHWLALSLVAAAACALDAGWLLAAALGFAFQRCLLEQQGERAPDDPEVQRR